MKLLVSAMLGFFLSLLLPAWPIYVLWLLLFSYVTMGVLGCMKLKPKKNGGNFIIGAVVICLSFHCFILTQSVLHRKISDKKAKPNTQTVQTMDATDEPPVALD